MQNDPATIDTGHKMGVYSDMGRDFWIDFRQHYLGIIDKIERRWGITPIDNLITGSVQTYSAVFVATERVPHIDRLLGGE